MMSNTSTGVVSGAGVQAASAIRTSSMPSMPPMPSRQAGLGMWGWLGTLFVIGFIALVTVKCVPVYLNHLKVSTTISDIAKDSDNATADPFEIRREIQRRFDVDDTKHIKASEVKVQRTDGSRRLSYDYEVRVPLFANISIVIQFTDSKLVKR